MSKPYKAKSLAGAQRKVRYLMRFVWEQSELIETLDADRKALARLAATGPAFDNPLCAYEAKRIRDAILGHMGMNPDGTFIMHGESK